VDSHDGDDHLEPLEGSQGAVSAARARHQHDVRPRARIEAPPEELQPLGVVEWLERHPGEPHEQPRAVEKRDPSSISRELRLTIPRLARCHRTL